MSTPRQSPWVQLRTTGPHPLYFRKMVGDASRDARPGEVVTVYDKEGRLYGRGHFNDQSPIAVRMLTYGDAPVDDAFWRQRVGEAVRLRRETLRLDDQTDAYRLIHAEGDRLSGVVVERYADRLVFELFSLGMQQEQERVVGLLREHLGPPPTRPESAARPDAAARGPADWSVHTRVDDLVAEREGIRLLAPPRPIDAKSADARPAARQAGENSVIIREHGIRYRVDFVGGHKTGFFCDQRDHRRRLAEFTRGKTLLDLCCYTGGFSLNARLRGEASDVVAVDLDEKALAIAKENANLNQTRINFVHSDAFIYLRQMIENNRRFGVVVLDPPKFARSREELDKALIKYNDLNTLALQVVEPGGVLLTCSCSGLVSPTDFAEAIRRAARRAGRAVQVLQQGGAAGDHPVALECPESEYLKAFWLRVV